MTRCALQTLVFWMQETWGDMKHPCLHGSLISCTQCHSACGTLLQMSCWRMQPKVPNRKKYFFSSSHLLKLRITIFLCSDAMEVSVNWNGVAAIQISHTSLVWLKTLAESFLGSGPSLHPLNPQIMLSSVLPFTQHGNYSGQDAMGKKLMQTKKKVLCYLSRRVVWMLKQWVMKGDVRNGKHKTKCHMPPCFETISLILHVIILLSGFCFSKQNYSNWIVQVLKYQWILKVQIFKMKFKNAIQWNLVYC